MLSEAEIHSGFVTRYCVPTRTICHTPVAKDCVAIAGSLSRMNFFTKVQIPVKRNISIKAACQYIPKNCFKR